MPVGDDDGLELHRLYVHERAKGAGAADVLMLDAIAWARAKAAKALYYRRYGFQEHGEWEFMVGATADRDLIWRLAL
jgi:GNAT superfamily N-acetyltransferase